MWKYGALARNEGREVSRMGIKNNDGCDEELSQCGTRVSDLLADLYQGNDFIFFKITFCGC